MKNYNKSRVLAVVAAFSLSIALPVTLFAAGPASVSLGGSGNFTVLAKTGVSTTGTTLITGDIGVSPAAASYITGFGLNLPVSSAFSTSALVTGKVYAPGYADPTPAQLTTAVNDMQTAYTDAAGRTNPTATELGAGNIGGMTLAAGLYKWGTGVTIPTDVTLSGSANDVWIFQIAQNLNISSGKNIILSGGAQASNVFWVVAGQTTIGTGAVFNGNILDQTSIVLNTGATLNGRALAQAAVTLDSNAVTGPTLVSGSQYSYQYPTPYVAPYPTPYVAPTQTTNPTTLSTTDVVTLQAQLNSLVATAQSLQAQVLAKQQNSSSGSSSIGQQVKMIGVDLDAGITSNDVSTLQQFLISQNKGPSAQALASVGVTGYFGSLTRSALVEFQANVGINPALGYFGPITRTYLSTH